MAEKQTTRAADVQGLRISVLSRAMEAIGEEPVLAGFLSSISGLKGGTRETQSISPINDRDYEDIVSVGKKTSATMNMSILYSFVQDGKTQDYDGVHYLEKAFEENSEVFILAEINDERKTLLKFKVKLSEFSIQSEANNRFSANIVAQKIGEAKDITPFRFEEGERVRHTIEKFSVGDLRADYKGFKVYSYEKASTLTEPGDDDKRSIYEFEKERGVCVGVSVELYDLEKKAFVLDSIKTDYFKLEEGENVVHQATDLTQGEEYPDLAGKIVYYYPNKESLKVVAKNDTRTKYEVSADDNRAGQGEEQSFNGKAFE